MTLCFWQKNGCRTFINYPISRRKKDCFKDYIFYKYNIFINLGRHGHIQRPVCRRSPLSSQGLAKIPKMKILAPIKPYFYRNEDEAGNTKGTGNYANNEGIEWGQQEVGTSAQRHAACQWGVYQMAHREFL
jgi:hypothetical protein